MTWSVVSLRHLSQWMNVRDIFQFRNPRLVRATADLRLPAPEEFSCYWQCWENGPGYCLAPLSLAASRRARRWRLKLTGTQWNKKFLPPPPWKRTTRKGRSGDRPSQQCTGSSGHCSSNIYSRKQLCDALSRSLDSPGRAPSSFLGYFQPWTTFFVN